MIIIYIHFFYIIKIFIWKNKDNKDSKDNVMIVKNQ